MKIFNSPVWGLLIVAIAFCLGFWVCTKTHTAHQLDLLEQSKDSVITQIELKQDSLNAAIIDKQILIRNIEKLDSIKTKIYENKLDSIYCLPDSVKSIIYLQRADEYKRKYLSRYRSR